MPIIENVSIASNITLVLAYGNTEEIIIQVPDNLTASLEVDIDNKSLAIGYGNTAIRGSSNTTVYITSPDVHNITLSGASLLRSDNELKYPSLQLDLSGASKIDASLNNQDLNLQLSGASKADLYGNTTTLQLSASGASSVEHYDMTTRDLIANLSGASEVWLTVNSSLDVTASGGSKVKYKGPGRITHQNLSGGSTIEHF